MDSEASIDGIVTDAQPNEDLDVESAFHAGWEASDTAHLQPSNLPIARVQRAWERKPLSPLSRRKVRVGKVWKRSALAPVSTRNAEDELGMGDEHRGLKRLKARTSVQSPLKPVKKLCMDSKFGLGARVSQWEGRGSPVRKIVTRSALAGELVALPDAEEEDVDQAQDEDHATIEILDEDGQTMEVNTEDEASEQEWSDVEEQQEELVDAPFDDTMMHFGDAVMHVEEAEHLERDENKQPRRKSQSQHVAEPTTIEIENAGASAIVHDRAADAEQEPNIVIEQPVPKVFSAPVLAAPLNVVLPDGFVSPVKQRRKLGPRTSKAVAAARRRTLPVQFAPAVPVASISVEDVPIDIEPAAEVEVTVEGPGVEVGELAAESDVSTTAIGDQHEAEWEDVEDEVEEADAVLEVEVSAGPEPVAPESRQGAQAETMELTVSLSLNDESSEPANDAQDSGAEDTSILGMQLMERLPSSPVPTFEGPHPRLPLRRSPRRKSSSPLKHSTSVPTSEMPHFLAFTPVKRPNATFSFSPIPATDVHKELMQGRIQPAETNGMDTDMQGEEHPIGIDDMELEAASPILRASSAPPEEPQMSPRRPARPRVSDDTALLQAFLHRAAERKSSRRVSATEAESVSNRRDSDAVKAALASSAKPDVLMDLDPNSPSPRKTSASALLSSSDTTTNLSTNTTDPSLPVITNTTATEQIDPIEDSGPTPRTGRKSGRSRKKPQVLSQSVYSTAAASVAPSKITIRNPVANANVVEPKRTEVQERALVTRNNTKKNKGGSVLPTLRLTKMAAENGSADASMAEAGGEEEVMEDVVMEGRKGIRWAETLVSFYTGGVGPELSQLSDEPEERMPWERPAIADDEEEKKEVEVVPAPPAPADTPSKPKPKLRRLKAPRTAATVAAAKASTTPAPEATKTDTKVEEASEPAAAPEVLLKPAPKPRCSRIATPAKGLTNTSLLPADLAPPPATTPAAEKKPAPRKKLASKLPAPSTTTTSLGVGKENLIASPPKKKPAAAAPSALPTVKTFAPKLDFGAKTKLEPTPASAGTGEVEGILGLASPAKKGRKRAVVFGRSVGGTASAPTLGGEDGRGGSTGEETMLGLKSPAKKRTTRRAGV